MDRTARRRAAAGALWVALALVVPAAPASARQGEEVVLQWYQRYEHGLDAAERGDWRTALDDFAAAARVRRQPADRARTYGTRFLVDYDPAFQQARCLVALGRLDEAEPLLDEAEAAGVTDYRQVRALRARLVAGRAAAEEAEEAGSEPAPPPVRESEPAAAATAPAPSPTAAPPPAVPVPVPVAPAEGGAGDPASREPERGERAEPPVATREPARTTPPQPGPAAADEEPGGDAAADSAAERAGEVDRESGPEVAAEEPVGEPPAEPADAGSGSRDRLLAAVGAALLALLAAVAVVRRRRAPARGGSGMRSSTVALPRRIGSYRVTGELGRGGMATTYRAERARDGLPVAIKVPHETGDPTYLERFLREGRLGETLHHPRIVRIVEAGEDGGRPFLALELIPGHTLRSALDEATAPLPLAQALTIARDIAEALDYAHGKGVVHRDLKPENVMLLPDGSVKVMDFGVARIEGQPGLTTSRFFFGSPVYAAPELVDPLAIDHRADLYSLGVVLFELLEGRPPFHHESVFKLLEKHQREPLPDPSTLERPLPPEVWRVLARLLAKAPEDRYASAQELLVDLGALLNESQWTRGGDELACRVASPPS